MVKCRPVLGVQWINKKKNLYTILFIFLMGRGGGTILYKAFCEQCWVFCCVCVFVSIANRVFIVTSKSDFDWSVKYFVHLAFMLKIEVGVLLCSVLCLLCVCTFWQQSLHFDLRVNWRHAVENRKIYIKADISMISHRGNGKLAPQIVFLCFIYIVGCFNSAKIIM